eukprot:746408-Prymnesium_polylepis.1
MAGAPPGAAAAQRARPNIAPPHPNMVHTHPNMGGAPTGAAAAQRARRQPALCALPLPVQRVQGGACA